MVILPLVFRSVDIPAPRDAELAGMSISDRRE
jgi:hypothetical protein